MGNSAAFFDIDGTLYREGLIAEIFKKLVKSDIIKPEKWYNEVRPEYQRWDRRQGNYDDYLLKIADIYTEAVKGLHKSQIDFIAKRVVEQKGDRVYTFTRDKIKWHKEQGHKVITISGSPKELVREMSLKHGFDDYLGAEYVIDENSLYTGEVIPMWDSKSKSKAIDYFAEKYDLDLDLCYAYGDTSGDFSMFKKVKYPICVNPTRELLKKVLEDNVICEKVQIAVERKDVIYSLTAKNIRLL
ncbi:MAG: HAD-IB family hydrolase [Clostridia bacterium]|jgi:HAD superfamily hydrolase (TIGR01490 family)|nr:HAD-IB family hydrolase [Clostridia bacterium]